MFGFFAGRRLSRLQERIEKLEAELRTANLDWDELYQKCRKLLGRTTKERAIVDAHNKPEEPAPGLMAQSGNHRGFLSDRQKQLQQEILRRRSGG